MVVKNNNIITSFTKSKRGCLKHILSNKRTQKTQHLNWADREKRTNFRLQTLVYGDHKETDALEKHAKCPGEPQLYHWTNKASNGDLRKHWGNRLACSLQSFHQSKWEYGILTRAKLCKIWLRWYLPVPIGSWGNSAAIKKKRKTLWRTKESEFSDNACILPW